MEITKRIIFFDGICILCDGFVTWAWPKFNPGEIYFAPLQGVTAKKLLPNTDLSLESVIYYRDGQIYKKTEAIQWLLFDMNGFYKAISIMLRYIPTFLSHLAYDLIARYRYNVFGKLQSCRLPTEQEKKYFLD